MSEQRFKDAKSNLALSQQLRDSLMRPSAPIPQPQQKAVSGAAQIPEEPNGQVEEQKEVSSIEEAVKKAIQPLAEQIQQLLEKEAKEDGKESEVDTTSETKNENMKNGE